MTLSLAAEAPPIRRDDDGTLRVGDTRVLLEIVVNAYKSGKSPDEIVRSFPTLSLPDTYAVISWYLRHRDEAEKYLAERDAAASALRKDIEATQQPIKAVQDRLRTLGRK